jgi:EAL domain-containing protein (putative c-di-GMP-specific phosphodiesterase class I)
MRALEQLALPASAIELEIAEHVLLGHADFMRDHLNALLASGFSILCGELGRNHSSLAQWRDTPMTGLRIDETLTRQPQARESGVVIEALLMIASTCGLCTIATGVQDADAAAVLSLLGVQRLQGRHFGEPMDCRDFERLLERDRHAP